MTCVTLRTLHEPLRTVISYSQLLDRRHAGSMDEQARSYLAWIVGAGQRLDALLRNLRAYWAAGEGDTDFLAGGEGLENSRQGKRVKGVG